MSLYILKWDVIPEKFDAYLTFTESAIKRTLAVPGVVEFRAYRLITGNYRVAVTYEFSDLASWAAWYASEDCQKVLDELRTYTSSMATELWGSSPIVPKPIRPGG